MSRRQMSMHRFIRRRNRGQSIPLIALMILVLVAMVGLSVDVGNTFAEERRAVAASNAASLGAMDAYIRRNAATTTDTIYQRIDASFRENGIDLAANPNLRLNATYLDAEGQPISNALPTITQGDSSPVPDNVAYIQVRIDGVVDTYFARVVGRDDLPLNATSYAGTCPANSGVYPIAVSNEKLSEFKFRDFGDNEYTEIETGPYRNYTSSRLYVQDNTPGGFSWLRWMDGIGANGTNANSNAELSASLTGDGNIAAGFDEAPWPNVSSPPRPTVYPEQPGQLNVGDWVWGSTGFNASTSRMAALDSHIEVGTRMILPIYDTYVGQGSNAQFRVVRLGLFVVLDYGREPQKGPWIEMIFLGDAQRQGTACVATPPTPDDTKIELFGPVALWPEYQIRPNDHKPIQYVIVLDVSGSMNATFDGLGWKNNRATQCTNGPAGSPPAENCGAPGNAWPTVGERRIFVAKEALKKFVQLANLRNSARYDATKPFDQVALVWYNEGVVGSRTFSNDATTVSTSIMDAGKAQNDPYKTQGGTNTASALFQAGEILKTAPKKTTELGREWEYKRVVILLTDGVSNHFFKEPDTKSAGRSEAKTYTKGSFCNSLGNTVVENAQCQTTDIGGKYQGMDRPITQMENVSKERLKPQADVYVVALSDIPATGLRTGVASVPAFYYQARNLEVGADGKNNVDLIFEAINKQVENDVCLPGVDNQWRYVIPPEHFQSTNGLVYPTVGEVFLTDIGTGTRYVAPIKADTNGRLVYRFTDLPRGSYQLTPYLFYRHPLDPPGTLPRQYSLIETAGTTVADITITLEPSLQRPGFTTVVEQPLNLRLTGNVCAQP
jgi:hypothetical protein